MHPPHIGGIATATFYLKKHLEDLGHTILVINYDYPKRSLSGVRLFLKVIWNMNIIRKEKIDLIHAHYLVPPGLAGVILKYIMKKPLVVSAHGSDVNYLGKTPLGNMLCRIVVRFSDALIANSIATQKGIKELGEDSKVIYLGVERERFFSRNEKREAILYVGSLTKNKCVSDLIEAARDIGKVWIVGNGPERKNLERLARDIKCDCTFFGYREDVEEFMRKARVLVLPSQREGFGLTVIEALSCGTPVIARKDSGLEEILPESLLFSDKEEMKRLIERLASDEAYRKAVCDEGLQMATRFSWEENAKETEAIYRKILEKSHVFGH
jgi:glycosyltransferase involved in cell wall biosynthesis